MEQFVTDDSYLPRFRTLQCKIINLSTDYQTKLAEYKEGRGKLTDLKTCYQTVTNIDRKLTKKVVVFDGAALLVEYRK